jgi:hypothetical protein
MRVDERFETAFQSPDRVNALRDLVLELSRQGHTKAEIIKLFEEVLVQLREQETEREEDEDAVMDVLDFLVGWCRPHARLLPDE